MIPDHTIKDRVAKRWGHLVRAPRTSLADTNDVRRYLNKPHDIPADDCRVVRAMREMVGLPRNILAARVRVSPSRWWQYEAGNCQLDPRLVAAAVDYLRIEWDTLKEALYKARLNQRKRRERRKRLANQQIDSQEPKTNPDDVG